MKSRAIVLTLLLPLVLPAVPLPAQVAIPRSAPPTKRVLQENLTIGGQVRLRMDGPGPTEVEGVLVGIDGPELLIAPEGGAEVVRVQTDRVWRYQVPAGERRQPLKGLGLGAGAGALAGAVLGLASGDDPDSCWLICYTAGEKAAMGGIVLGVTGAVIGLVAGSLTKATVWKDVPSSSLRPSIVPSSSGGLEFRLTLPTGR